MLKETVNGSITANKMLLMRDMVNVTALNRALANNKFFVETKLGMTAFLAHLTKEVQTPMAVKEPNIMKRLSNARLTSVKIITPISNNLTRLISMFRGNLSHSGPAYKDVPIKAMPYRQNAINIQ